MLATGSPTRHAPSVGRAGLVVAVGLLAGLAAVQLDWRLLVPIAVAAPWLTWVVLADMSEPAPAASLGSRGSPGLLLSDGYLAWTWVALILTPAVRVFSQDAQRYAGQAAAGQLTVDNLLMLAASCAALLAVAVGLHRGWPARPPALVRVYLLFALLAVLSTVWSRLPLYSVGRGMQYVALAAFTALCVGLCLRDRSLFPRLLDRMLRPYVLALGALVAWGAVTVGLGDRFHWPGTHPNAVASLLAIGVLLVLVTPNRRRLLAPVPWQAVVVVLAAFVFQTGARGYSATMVGALIVAVVVMGLRDTRWLALLAGLAMTVVGSGLLFFREAFLDFVLRDQSGQTLRRLNGRIEAWQSALANPVGSEVWGVGLGANQRQIQAHWDPFNAHSAWVDLLQALGVIGVSLMATVVIGCILLSALRRFAFGAMFGAFVLAASLTSSTIALPDAMAGLLSLVVVGAATAPHARHPRPGPGEDEAADPDEDGAWNERALATTG